MCAFFWGAEIAALFRCRPYRRTLFFFSSSRPVVCDGKEICLIISNNNNADGRETPKTEAWGFFFGWLSSCIYFFGRRSLELQRRIKGTLAFTILMYDASFRGTAGMYQDAHTFALGL
jgi:hypothetical protein